MSCLRPRFISHNADLIANKHISYFVKLDEGLQNNVPTTEHPNLRCNGLSLLGLPVEIQDIIFGYVFGSYEMEAKVISARQYRAKMSAGGLGNFQLTRSMPGVPRLAYFNCHPNYGNVLRVCSALLPVARRARYKAFSGVVRMDRNIASTELDVVLAFHDEIWSRVVILHLDLWEVRPRLLKLAASLPNLKAFVQEDNYHYDELAIDFDHYDNKEYVRAVGWAFILAKTPLSDPMQLLPVSWLDDWSREDTLTKVKTCKYIEFRWETDTPQIGALLLRATPDGWKLMASCFGNAEFYAKHEMIARLLLPVDEKSEINVVPERWCVTPFDPPKL